MGFILPLLDRLICVKTSGEWRLPQKGFNAPLDSSLIFCLVAKDKGLPILAKAINSLDLRLCLKPNELLAIGLEFNTGLARRRRVKDQYNIALY